jgi:hypothetical protein
VRHGTEQRLALDQRLAHEAELEVFEVAQPAVEELGRGRRGRAREVALLGQQDRQAPPGRVPRDAAAVDAAADDEEIAGIVGILVRRHPPSGAGQSCPSGAEAIENEHVRTSSI